jgi:xylulokinase
VFLGLSLGTGRGETARAIAEGICFAIRDVITVMKEAGAPVEELRVTGKPGESAFLNQLKADITGLPVLVPRAAPAGRAKPAENPSGETVFLPAELLGLTALGAAALGVYASTAEAVRSLVGIAETFVPNRENKHIYDDAFGIYRETYRALKPLFSEIPQMEIRRNK